MTTWIQRWRLRRAERALNQARLRREARDLENPEYGGLLVEQLAEEHCLEQRIADLKRRLNGGTKCPECEALDSFVSDEPEDHLYCRKCGYEMVPGVSVII